MTEDEGRQWKILANALSETLALQRKRIDTLQIALVSALEWEDEQGRKCLPRAAIKRLAEALEGNNENP